MIYSIPERGNFVEELRYVPEFKRLDNIIPKELKWNIGYPGYAPANIMVSHVVVEFIFLKVFLTLSRLPVESAKLNSLVNLKKM